MSDKYIIRNCPALYQIEGMTNECLGTDYQCEECTDCVIKQIVEKCKYWQNRWTDDIDERDGFDQIIELLDIQEVE